MQRAGSPTPPRGLTRLLACLAFLAITVPATAQKPGPGAPAPASPLERIRQSGRIRIGYYEQARPFSFKDAAGKVDGYAVELCQKVADATKAELGLTSLTVDWVPVTVDNRIPFVQQGQTDLLCGLAETLGRRQEVAFSIPAFPGGIGAMLRSDAPARLREVLYGQRPSSPSWRASAGQLLTAQRFAVVRGTTAEPWLEGKLKEFQVTASVVPVESFDAAVQQLLDRQVHVVFADRAILLDVATRHPSGGSLQVLDRYYTFENMGLALARGDEAFRLTVDRALSRFYASGELGSLYRKWFGEPNTTVLTYFRWNTRPE